MNNPQEGPLAEQVGQIRRKWAILRGSPSTSGPETLTYIHIPPITQVGPTCGLVAISMVSSLTSKPLSPEDVLNAARMLGYSKQGEMFSAPNMVSLIRHTLDGIVDPVLHVGGLLNNKEFVMDELSNGTLFLVPYDADKDHSPACLKGHKAHWGILCGAVRHGENSYVLARQGKSKNVAIWPFESLHHSNTNLLEISPQRLSDAENYITCDIKECLAGQFISIRKV